MGGEEKNKSQIEKVPICYLVVFFIILIIGFFTIATIRYSFYWGSYEPERVAPLFPKIEIDLVHTESEDQIIVKHIDGDPLDWSKYKIIITNASDSADQATITTLSGNITGGQTSVFSNLTYIAMNDVKFEVGLGYDIEIYNLKEYKRELLGENMICEARID